MDIREFFREFINKEFQSDKAYDLKYFKTAFNISHNISRYHLQLAVDRGELCCLKVRNKTYYMKPEWKEKFVSVKLKGVSIR